MVIIISNVTMEIIKDFLDEGGERGGLFLGENVEEGGGEVMAGGEEVAEGEA